MTEITEELEGGLPRAGHRAEDGPPDAVVLGEGDYRYRVTGENWGRLPEGWGYREAAAVAVDQHDRVYVFNRGTKPLIVFDTDGNILDTWEWDQADGFSNPHGITVAPDGTLWCVDNGNSTVKHLTADGTLLLTLGVADNPTPRFSNRPFSVPVPRRVDARTGEFYVADGYSNAAVHKFSPEGRHLFTWGESGTDEGQFNIVHNVKVDREGWVYVADRENHRIQVFSPDGKFETQWVNLSRARPASTSTRAASATSSTSASTSPASRATTSPRTSARGSRSWIDQRQGAGARRHGAVRLPGRTVLLAARDRRRLQGQPLRRRGRPTATTGRLGRQAGAALDAEAGATAIELTPC